MYIWLLLPFSVMDGMVAVVDIQIVSLLVLIAMLPVGDKHPEQGCASGIGPIAESKEGKHPV